MHIVSDMWITVVYINYKIMKAASIKLIQNACTTMAFQEPLRQRTGIGTQIQNTTSLWVPHTHPSSRARQCTTKLPLSNYHHRNYISKWPAVVVETWTGGVKFCTHSVATDGIIGDRVTSLVFPLCLWTFATWLLQAATCCHNARGKLRVRAPRVELLIKQYP